MVSESCETVDRLRRLSPRHFEQFVADLWERGEGWNTEVSDKGADKGLDVMGQDPDTGRKTALQCKRLQNKKITSSQVREYSALREQWSDVSGVTIVTTTSFTQNAEAIAERLDVNCISAEDLVRLIDKYSGREILEWYTQGKPSEWS